MSLQIVQGRAHSGKTQYILDKAQQLHESGKPFVIVVPEQFTHLSEKRLINKIGSVKQSIAEVLSFDVMAKKINRRYPSNKKKLSAVGKSLIIFDLLSDIELNYYKSAALQSGFIDVCSQQIAELKKYMISSQMLIYAANSSDNPVLTLKLNDIEKIYTAYDNKIKDYFHDSDDELNILADNLELHKPYSGVTFLFDEFSSFNPQEKNIISILCTQCDDLILSMCANVDHKSDDLFVSTMNVCKNIVDICSLKGCKIKKTINLDNTFYDNDEMKFLEDNLYSPYKVEPISSDNINIFSFENPYAEVSYIAADISRKIRAGNMRYRDIGIVCSDIDSYSHIFRSVFNSYDIPYFFDGKTDVLDHAIISFVINILDVYINNYNSESVINFLKSGCIFADRDETFATDNYVTAVRASKNTWLSDERWNKSINSYTENKDLIVLLNGVRDKYILPIASFHDAIKGKNTVKYITENLYSYLLKIGFDKRVSGYIEYFNSINNISMAKQYELVWSVLIEALDTVVYILGDKKVSVSDYRKYLFTAFSQQKIGIIPTSLDEVVIGDIKRSRSESVKHQYIIGTVDGKFPAITDSGNVISDSDKASLKKLGIELSPCRDEQAYYDRFLIYSAITHPMCSLTVTYPTSDNSFSSVRPAYAVNILKKLFCSSDTSAKCSIYDNLVSERLALEYLAQHMQPGVNDYDNGMWQDVYSYFVDNGKEDSILKINTLLNSGKHINKISEGIIDRMFPETFYTSISRLQEYNSCRYSYYLKYMLGLKDKESYGVTGLDIGTLIHSILERSFSEADKYCGNLENADADYFSRYADEVLDEYISMCIDKTGEENKRDVFAVKRLKPMIVDALIALKQQIVNSKFRPIGYEITFDGNNCISLPLKNGKIAKITGKIDRADSFSDNENSYIRVIDYKTSAKSYSLDNALYGLDIQLIVYLKALVGRSFDNHPAGVWIFNIGNSTQKINSVSELDAENTTANDSYAMTGLILENPDVMDAYAEGSVKTNNKVSEAYFEAISDYVESLACESAYSMSDGCIDINPCRRGADTTSCSYCSYNAICDFADGVNGKFRYFPNLKNEERYKLIYKKDTN